MEMDRGEIWFVQERRFQRAYAVHWKGWVAGLLFVIAFFALVGFFISLDPFRPLNYAVLVLWWLSILALMFVYHLLVKNKTDRRWLTRSATARQQ
jgi:hypothetical protein